MASSESDELAFRLAQKAVELILRDPSLCDRFAAAVRALSERNGPKPSYEELEVACKDHTTLCALLLVKTDDGDAIRSVAPFYAVLPEHERLGIIRSFGRSPQT